MVRGILSPVGWILICCWLLGNHSDADPLAFVPTTISPDPPPQTAPEPPRTFRDSSDLDGTYLWLGPEGAANWIDSQWDSTFGIDASIVRVRERETAAALGASLGAAKWTSRGGGRLWTDLLVGTSLGGHMIGVSAGPLLELSDFAHPKIGGSVGIWGFVGITPYARVGTVSGLGNFAEIGIHIALPAFRR